MAEPLDYSETDMSDRPAQRQPPATWNAQADALWNSGQPQAAISTLLGDLNRHGQHKPSAKVLQLVYYLFQRGDWHSAAQCLLLQHASDPVDDEVLLNLAVCLSRSEQHTQATVHARRYVQRRPEEALAWDVLTNSLHACGHFDEARETGTQALRLKDRDSTAIRPRAAIAPRVLPAPSDSTADVRRDVIAFSLWGQQANYLWGALDNLLAAPRLYPGWQVRIYHDDSVPLPVQALLRELGADLRLQPGAQTTRQKLCWRFHVANDPTVHRFLVRDIDSVLHARERAAVDAWIESGKTFHVMRDWWTHTDLMLAGMWGGIAGVLPPITELLAGYRPVTMETPNVDQWFLRDVVWPLLRGDCLVHDRCFTMPGSHPWPTPTPPGTEHVGQDEHATDPQAQAERLRPWLERMRRA
jgi:hypothetical protein